MSFAKIVDGYGSLQSAIEAIREGAYDYLTKPFQIDELYVVVNNAVERVKLMRENNKLLDKLKETFESMGGYSASKEGGVEDRSGNTELIQALRERVLKAYTRTGSSGTL